MKKRLITVLSVLTAVITSLYADGQAQTQKMKLTLEQAVKSAAENNITVKKQALEIEDLKTKKDSSWNSISPSASLKGSLSENIEDNTSTLGISGTVSIGLSTNLYTTIQSAKLNYENGVLTYGQTCRQIEKEVRESFYKLLYEQENLILQKRSLETSLTQYKNNQEKFKNGQISELDVMTSRVNYEQQKPSVQQAETTLTNDLESFKQVLGIDLNVQLELEGSLDEVLEIKTISEELLPKKDSPAPDVESAEKQVEIEKNTLLSKRFSAYSPSISASYNYGKSKTTGDDKIGTTNSLSLGVTIPLDSWLPWSSSAVAISSQKKSLESAQLNLKETRTSIAVQTENCLRNINQAISQVESLKENVNLAEKTRTMTQTAYNYGKTDLLNLQNANDSVLSANVNLKSQAYTLISTILELEYILGIPFGTLSGNK